MQDLLANLHTRTPHIGSIRLGALGALLRGNDKHDLEALLQQDAILHGILDGNLDLYTARVRLRPHKVGVDDAHFAEAAQLLEAQRKQFARFGRRDDPARGREEPSVAVPAKVERGFALDAL